MDDDIRISVEQRYPSLSPQLRKAARFVIDNPEDVALNSMRFIATRAGVSPNVMLRLARELGFQSYKSFQERFQQRLVAAMPSNWKSRAEGLVGYKDQAGTYITAEIVDQEIRNLEGTLKEENIAAIERAADAIMRARRMYVLGLRSLFPISFYLHYVFRMFTDKSVLLTGLGGTFADQLRSITADDVVVGFSCRPYAKDTVKAFEYARGNGAGTVVVTDSRVSPAIDQSSINILVPTESKSFFPTLIPMFAVAQMLTTYIVAKGSDDIIGQIQRSEEQLGLFDTYVR